VTPAAVPRAVEHVLPHVDNPDLDADHDDVPCRFCMLENILGLGSPPRYADREVTEDLVTAIGNEPSSTNEALGIEE
jgi:hypothetical protein